MLKLIGGFMKALAFIIVGIFVGGIVRVGDRPLSGHFASAWIRFKHTRPVENTEAFVKGSAETLRIRVKKLEDGYLKDEQEALRDLLQSDSSAPKRKGPDKTQ